MAKVTMPQLGESVAEGTIGKWLKQPGDTVAFDDPLFEVSTDKVDSEIPSPYDGVLLEIVVPAEETVPVGAVLARIGEPGAAAPAAGAAPSGSAPAATGLPTAPGGAPSGGTPSAPANGAPIAKKMPATASSTTTRYSSACTGFVCVMQRTAASNVTSAQV